MKDKIICLVYLDGVAVADSGSLVFPCTAGIVGISINKLAFRAEIQRTQLKAYRDNKVQRIDLAVVARLCYALDCDLHDLLEYIPSEQKN